MNRWRSNKDTGTTRPRCQNCGLKILDGQIVLLLENFQYNIDDKRSNSVNNKVHGWVHYSCISHITKTMTKLG